MKGARVSQSQTQAPWNKTSFTKPPNPFCFLVITQMAAGLHPVPICGCQAIRQPYEFMPELAWIPRA